VKGATCRVTLSDERDHLGRRQARVEWQVADADVENMRRVTQLYGTSNLYVAGSSVFPSGGYANPTLTIVALAARLAYFLATLSAAPLSHFP
jgi:hypothetical protein